jgi:hypothetical protein
MKNRDNEVIEYLNDKLLSGELLPNQCDSLFGLWLKTIKTTDGVIQLHYKEYKHYPIWIGWYELTYKGKVKKFPESEYMRILRIIAYYLGWR